MKYSKKYIIFTILLVAVFVLKFQILAMDNATIDKFRGGTVDADIWYPLIADSANQSKMSLLIDNKEYTNDKFDFYMNSCKDIMVPVDILIEALNCSAHVYDNTRLLVEKHTDVVNFELDKDTAILNGKSVELSSGFIKKDDSFYVSLNDLVDMLGYNYSFSVEDNVFSAIDASEGTSIVPSSYDLRDRERVSTIRNQGTYGTCWAFAAVSAIESALLPEEINAFSVDHMTMNNSYNVNQYDGGKYTMGMAYLAAWQGPVYEKDDPYGDGKTNSRLRAVKHVQQMRIIDGKDYEAIKTAVFKYGGVQSSLYSSLRSATSQSSFYNRTTNSYCYIGTEKPNHDIVIIGWDDNYSKDNFSVPLEGDGAFICQNSWGENFGDQGVFYVSYYDTNIGTHNVVYSDIEDKDNYDNIYQSDLCGWVGEFGVNNNESIYGANVFTAKNNENVRAASFYATGANSSYKLFFVSDFEDENSFTNMKKVAEGTVDQAGYYTIDFDESVEVAKDEKFAVVLYISTPGSNSPLAVEYDSDDASLENVILDDGEGYISKSGSKFVNVKKYVITQNNKQKECNLCIKAFTDDK